MALLNSGVVAASVDAASVPRAGFAARHGKLAARTLAIAASLSVSFIFAILTVASIELVSRQSLPHTFDYFGTLSRPAWTTCGVFFFVYLALDAVVGRQHKAVLIVAPLVFLAAFISQQKQIYLTDPLYPADLLFGRQIVELMPVLVKDRPATAVLMAVGAIGAISALVCLWVFAWRRFRPLSPGARAARLALAVPMIAGFASVMDYNQFSWMRDRLGVVPIIWDQTENYRRNGFVMAFAINLPMANVHAPAGYGADAVARIPAKPLPVGTSHRTKPDIIVVMSESLWDPTQLSGVALTPDPMPVIRKAQSGTIFSPEFGGLTANVEFEALTGFSNAFLPTGSVPYQQYVRKSLPSLATFFRGEGYSTRAIHPFRGWFWNRTSVYDAFGFDSFEDMDVLPEMPRRGNFVSDEALTQEIIRQADLQENPFFFFAVTLQGHGPYEANRYVRNTIGIKSDLGEREQQMLATYAQGVREADKSLKMLMDWARKRDRETIVVLFGDHLPPLGAVYRETGYMPGATASRTGTPEQMKREHETPLVIWSNKAGALEDTGTVSPAFLPYYVLKQAGFEHPYYTGFLGDVHERFRVVDRHMTIDGKGAAKTDWLRQKTLDPLLRDFRFLQYDMMFGRQHGLERFFFSHVELIGS